MRFFSRHCVSSMLSWAPYYFNFHPTITKKTAGQTQSWLDQFWLLTFKPDDTFLGIKIILRTTLRLKIPSNFKRCQLIMRLWPKKAQKPNKKTRNGHVELTASGLNKTFRNVILPTRRSNKISIVFCIFSTCPGMQFFSSSSLSMILPAYVFTSKTAVMALSNA